MKKAAQKSPKKTAAHVQKIEFRPYRVLFLVIAIGVTTIVLLAYLGVSADY